MQDDFLNIKISDWNYEKKAKICIVSIIEDEMSEIIKEYNMSSRNGPYIYWEGCINESPNITIHCYQQNESGNIYSTQITNYVLEKDYDYYFYIGTSGAVQAKLYDVIIANQIIYMEKGTNITSGREYDGKAPEITEREKNLINTFLLQLNKTNEINFSVYAAPVFSGENVEKNPNVEELEDGRRFARHLAAIDMESFGVFQELRFYESFKRKEKSVFVIRGISDKADELKNSVYEDGLDSKERKKLAMQNVLIVLNNFILWLKSLDDQD